MSKDYRKYPLWLTDSGLRRKARDKGLSGAYIEFDKGVYRWSCRPGWFRKYGQDKKTLNEAHTDFEKFVNKL